MISKLLRVVPVIVTLSAPCLAGDTPAHDPKHEPKEEGKEGKKDEAKKAKKSETKDEKGHDHHKEGAK
jgi:hypothetical protein